jgi:outer membrane protein assembly factor BamB
VPTVTKDPEITVDVYQPDRVWAGTTLLPDNHNPQRHRIIEVNMLGEIVWEYVVPEKGFVEAELLPNNNILYTVGAKGVYEIDRSGKIVWSYLTSKIDHDADRLPDGNTIFVFGMNDQKSDPQVTEVNPKGEIVWSWYAKDYFDKPPNNNIFNEGWAHTNAVSRLSNGNTLISPRNFNLVVEVDPGGEVVRTYGEGVFRSQHDPEMLSNGNILLANQNRPQRATEYDPETGKIVWEYLIPDQKNWPVRDANRLPNGNTLITGATEIVEVTPEGEIVWRLRLQGVSFSEQEAAGRGFYKADRISLAAP